SWPRKSTETFGGISEATARTRLSRGPLPMWCQVIVISCRLRANADIPRARRSTRFTAVIEEQDRILMVPGSEERAEHFGSATPRRCSLILCECCGYLEDRYLSPSSETQYTRASLLKTNDRNG